MRYPLRQYRFILELPEGLKLLDKTRYYERWIGNVKPEKVNIDEVERNEGRYMRYTLSYSPTYITSQRTCYSQLAVRVAGSPQKQSSRIYYRRLAKGNFTELEQSTPGFALPSVRGKMPREFILFRYVSLWDTHGKSKEHLRTLVEQCVRSGQNYFDIVWKPAWQKEWYEGNRWLYRKVIELGGRIVVLPLGGGNLGLNYGSLPEGHCPDFVEWFRRTPDAHGRWYRRPRGETNLVLCNQWLAENGESFLVALRREYERLLRDFPDTKNNLARLGAQ